METRPDEPPEVVETQQPPSDVQPAPAPSGEASPLNTPYHAQTQGYGGGHIQARHGRINAWLGAVYAVMFGWALYYAYTHWGGLGPGLDLTR
jgi:hypothetical protein